MYIKKQQSGFVLVLALVLLAVMTLIGVSSMESSSMELKAAGNAQQHQVAFNATQSLIEFGVSGLTNIDYQKTAIPQDVTVALLPTKVKEEASSLSAQSTYVGCSVGVGSSIQKNKGFRYNFFEIKATASNKTGTATSIQGQGVRFPTAACSS